ncbi:MAG: PepSY domain-containing protein [Azoarcus sp.]|nr:PepSY domain-containing protein [Azoarcus sp.]
MSDRHHAMRTVLVIAGLAGMLPPRAVAAASFQEAHDVLRAKGYTAIHDLEPRHGLWAAEATTGNGVRVEVLIEADNRVIEAGAAGTASARDVATRLQDLGYTRINDIELDDACWEAEAYDAAGRKVELVLHPLTLEILSETGDAPDDLPLPPLK